MSPDGRKTFNEALALLEPRAGGRAFAMGRLTNALADGAIAAVILRPISLRGITLRAGDVVPANLFRPTHFAAMLKASSTWLTADFTVAESALEKIDLRSFNLDDRHLRSVSASANWPLVGALAWVALRSLEGVAGILDPLAYPPDRGTPPLHRSQLNRRKAAAVGTLSRDIAESRCRCRSPGAPPATWQTCRCLHDHLANLQSIGLREVGAFAASTGRIGRPLVRHELAEIRIRDDRLGVNFAHGIDEVYVETGFLYAHWPATNTRTIAKASAVSRCELWLKAELANNPHGSVKHNYLTNTLQLFPDLTANAFNDVWRRIAPLYGANRPGRRKNHRK